MSRIGNRVIKLAQGVSANVEGNKITVKGTKGELSLEFNKLISVEVNEDSIVVKRANETKEAKSLHGTTNALITNMVKGVSEGFTKELEAIGVGYKFQVSGTKLTVNAGYSHPVVMIAPQGITLEAPSNTELTVKGINKQLVSEFAANVRKIREPEPYKGKGIRYKGEYVRRKEGKKAAK